MARIPCDLALIGATVLPFDRGFSTLADCDIVISNGRIGALGPGAAAAYAPVCVLDGRKLIVIPGLCNGHTHSTEALARGRADGARLDVWIEQVWASMDHSAPATLELAVFLSAAEMLHGGVTSVVDHFRQIPMRDQAVDAVAQAWQSTGMRSMLAIMLRDRGTPGWVAGNIPDASDQLALCARASRRWQSHRLQVALGPSAPTRCSDQLLAGASKLAADEGMRIHMHIDETREEAARAHALFGQSAVRHLGRMQLLGPQLTLAHAVWVDQSDITLLGTTRTGVVHNPLSNLRLGSGRAPLERFRAGGVPMAIGTDGAASNDSQNVLEAVKLAALLPRIALEDPGQWPLARDVLDTAATSAATLFGMGAGHLGAGEPADLAAFDADALGLVPPGDLYSQIGLAGVSLSARHVIVAGEVVLLDGNIRTFDEHAVRDQAMRMRLPAAQS